MPTNYDPIAEKYKRSKLQPWRTEIEGFTLRSLWGDLDGRSVVDLACGEGHYTRMLAALGAKPVVGVDRSEGMIALARAEESARPLGIDYLVEDCRTLRLDRKFELVTAAYLLNYARSEGELAAMAEGIARHLEPGGRFVTVNAHPEIDFARGASYRKYGFEIRCDEDRGEGTPYRWIFQLDDGSVEVENYRLSIAAHESAFRSAGFEVVAWSRPRVAPSAVKDRPSGFWDAFLEHPPIVALECRLA